MQFAVLGVQMSGEIESTNAKILTKRGKTWLIACLAGLAVVLVVVAATVYFTTGDTIATTGAGTLAAVAAAEALRRRQAAHQVVTEAKTNAVKVMDEIETNANETENDMDDVPTEVASMTDEERVDAGNDILGGAEKET